MQGGWYYRGAKANGLDVVGAEFIAIELERPHGISFHDLDESELDAMQDKIGRLARTMATCKMLNQYPNYPAIRHMIALKEDNE